MAAAAEEEGTGAAPAPAPSKLAPQCATLYVGDLDERVTEQELAKFFAVFGPISSTRVCRDRSSGASLRYAYVNFLSFAHADKARKAMNHIALMGKPMRIMWSKRDPISRKTGAGNLFVRNLRARVDGAELERLFSAYGAVESCKVAVDEMGRSKGFGFVQMGSEEAALSAIAALNGKTSTGLSEKLYVSKFLQKNKRQTGVQEPEYTNLYVKNLDGDITADILKENFSVFGKINSAVVMKDKDGKSKGFGFVDFESGEQAKKALEALNGSTLGLKIIYVGRAQKKAERKELLKLQFAEAHGSNVYVKFLDESIDDKALREHFAVCGKILSAKVMLYENGESKGFGFICFSSLADANAAVAKFNGTIFHNKRIYVAIAQRKEDRQQLNFAKSIPGKGVASYGFSQMYYSPYCTQIRNNIPGKPGVQISSLPYQSTVPTHADYAPFSVQANHVPYVPHLVKPGYMQDLQHMQLPNAYGSWPRMCHTRRSAYASQGPKKMSENVIVVKSDQKAFYQKPLYSKCQK